MREDPGPDQPEIEWEGTAETITRRDTGPTALSRRAGLLHLLGRGLIVIGSVGMAAWLYLTIRALDQVGAFSDFQGFPEQETGFGARLEIVAQNFSYALFAGQAVVLGGLASLAADWVAVRGTDRSD